MLHRRDQLCLDARFKQKAVSILAAGAVMGAALWFAGPLLDPFMAGGLVERTLALAALCGGGALIYGLASLGFGAYRISELKSQLSRSKKAD